MGTTDSIPIISQIKSLVEVCCGNAVGARRTQINFSNQCVVVSQVKSLVQSLGGDNVGARQTQEIYLNNAVQTINGIANGTPGVGHLKGSIHYIRGEKEAGDQAMKSASRTIGVIGGGVGGMIIGGPIGAFAGGIAVGAAMDGITTGVDSLVHDEYKPAGIVQSCTEVYLMAEGRRDGSKSGQIFDIAFGLVGDGLSGYMSGKCYKAVKENLQTKQASRIRIEDQVKSKCEEVKSYQKTDLVQQKPVKINQKISNQAQKNPKIGSRASHQNGSLQPKIRARIDPLNILPESLDSLNVDGQINIQRVYESMKQFKAEYLDIGSVGEINNQFDLQSAIPNVSDLDGIIRNSSNTHTKIMETHAFKNLIIESDKLLAQAQEKPAQFRVANNSPQLVKESVNEVANFN